MSPDNHGADSGNSVFYYKYATFKDMFTCYYHILPAFRFGSGIAPKLCFMEI